MLHNIPREIFKPIDPNPKSVYRRVVDEIKRSIYEGRMVPGDRLPAERVLANILGVSRTSVREALKMLASEGLVNIRHGQGAFISEQNPDEYLKQFTAQLTANRTTVEHLFEIRKILEPQAVRWVAERGAEGDINKLVEMVTVTKRQLGRLRSGRLSLLADHDSDFHYCLAQASGNSVLVRLVLSMLDLLADSRSRSLSIPGRGERSVRDHYKIAEALQRREPEEAAAAMQSHLEDVEQQIMVAWRQTDR